MTLTEYAQQKIDAIPRWQFWRRWERQFWEGAQLADYARATGSTIADSIASRAFDQYADRIRAKYGTITKLKLEIEE